MATIGTNYIIISSTVGVLKKGCEMSCGGTDSSVLTPNFRVNNFALCHSLSSLVWKTFCFCVVFLDIVRTFSLTLKKLIIIDFTGWDIAILCHLTRFTLLKVLIITITNLIDMNFSLRKEKVTVFSQEYTRQNMNTDLIFALSSKYILIVI